MSVAKNISVYSIRLVRESGCNYSIPAGGIASPENAASAINAMFALHEQDREVFGILLLNTKNKIAGATIVSIGTLNHSVVHPREVFKAAILANAAGIICFHNHPSGDPAPSADDITVTDRIAKAGEILGIKVLDHIIIGHDGRFTSLANEGYIK